LRDGWLLRLYAAKTVITETSSSSAIGESRKTATLRCAAVTDQLTTLKIRWFSGNNASDSCASWRTIDEHQQQVLVELDAAQSCCAVACSASNGLSTDSRSVEVCRATSVETLPTEYRHGTLQMFVQL